MTYIGVDPGASGGIAFISDDGDINVHKMPDTERETHALLKFWNPQACFAFIEHVHSMPKQGVVSSFKFGQSYGFLRAILIANEIAFDQVTPQRWQKELGCMSRGNKNVTKAKAQQLFPAIKVTHATADALLIAEYARRMKLRGAA